MNPDKKQIFAAAIASQKSIIHDLEKRTKDILSTDGNVNEEEYDNTEQSIKSTLIEEAEMLNDELKFVKDELTDLEKMNKHHQQSNIVAPGAVVETNHGNLFVSVSIEGFNIGKSHFFGLSTRSPLYKKMKGMKTGDKFRFGKTAYVIHNIY